MQRAPLALFCVVLACGGDPSQAGGPITPAVDKTPPPPEVMSLVVQVDPPNDQATRVIGTRLQWSLSKAGFQVVGDRGQPHDVEIKLATSSQVVPSFWQVQVNGRTRVKLRVHVVAAVVGLQPPARVDILQTDLEMNEGDEPEEGDIGRLVLAYAKSPNLARWATSHAAPPNAPDGIMPSSTDAPPDPKDEADWQKVDVASCQDKPTAVGSCTSVLTYMQRHPRGAHVQQAQTLLSAASAEQEKEERDWLAVHFEVCFQKKTEDACAGVEVFEHRYPNSSHTAEAKRVLGH